jgi:hypothetical protein
MCYYIIMQETRELYYLKDKQLYTMILSDDEYFYFKECKIDSFIDVSLWISPERSISVNYKVFEMNDNSNELKLLKSNVEFRNIIYMSECTLWQTSAYEHIKFNYLYNPTSKNFYIKHSPYWAFTSFKLRYESIYNFMSSILKYHYYKNLNDIDNCHALNEEIKLLVSGDPSDLRFDFYNIRQIKEKFHRSNEFTTSMQFFNALEWFEKNFMYFKTLNLETINDMCPICLDNKECIKGHFNCSHHVCNECFVQMTKNICMLCRSS